ncbi:transmembrane protein, putative [Rhizoctonia solani AG-3 Rhs1AP]|uniref:Transmembrane protein, putative n=2 Tax=Rhizoctonia solani AG-3 TaxID=1086053 RepID=X8IY28_9AGAM|nr:transmembrane protein, putative [Rhizoctonia solani AG-3 Rhs1AP]KEP51377.1 putative transmembrane protein [Rhizoctonia solani 123E]
MGKTKTSVPVFGVPENALLPILNPPDDIHPALAKVHKLVEVLVATIVGYWFFKAIVTTYSNPNRPWRGRGAQQAVVKAPPPVAPAENIRMIPNQFQRYFMFLISAWCSSMVVVWLTNLIGATRLPSAVDLPLDLPRVLDIVNESTGHLTRNVAVASSGVCYLKVGLELVDLVCRTH